MARIHPSDTERKAVARLRSEVMKYFEVHWNPDWSAHGPLFKGFAHIHNKNSFYEDVKNKIETKLNEKYGVVSAANKSISKDSIRRFFTDTSKGFDDKVLNAFLILTGSDNDWDSYLQNVAGTSSFPAKKKVPLSKKLWMAGAVILMLTTGITGYIFTQAPGSFSPVFTASVLPGSGFPREVKISYDLTKAKYKTAVIMAGNHRKNLSEVKGDMIIQPVEIPTRFHIKLILDGNVTKELKLLIPSEGWWGGINNKLPLPKSAFLKDGILHVPAFDRLKNNYGEYYTSFLNFREFGIDGDHFTLEADVLNGPGNGGIWAYDVSVDIIGTQSDIIFNLLNPDATRYARLKVALTDFKEGPQASYLDRLGVDLSRWRHLSLTTSHNTFSIKLDDETLIQHTYQGEIGEIMGIQFFMKGSGAVKNVRLQPYDDPEKVLEL